MNNLGKYTTLSLFLLFIFGFGISTFLFQDRASSYWENRSLAQEPTITKDSFLDGSFTEAYETYVVDQFPLRDQWMKAHTHIQKTTNQTFINDYYETDDHYVLAKPLSYFATESIVRSSQSMNELSAFTQSKGIELYYFYLPSRIIALDELYPESIEEGYTEASKDFLYDNVTHEHVNKFDLSTLFSEQYNLETLKGLYYQTDHHWNEEGALKGYEFIHNELNQSSQHMNSGAFDAENYKKVCANDNLSYLGSYNLQMYKSVTGHTDEACHYVSNQIDSETDFQVYVGPVESGQPVKFSDLFGSKMNGTSGDITYAGVFMNDYAEISIVNRKKPEGGKLLIVKDSFANAINFLVAEQYAETVVFDIRYYTEQTLQQYMEQHDFDTVVILYNGETFFNSMYSFN